MQSRSERPSKPPITDRAHAVGKMIVAFQMNGASEEAAIAFARAWWAQALAVEHGVPGLSDDEVARGREIAAGLRALVEPKGRVQ